MRCNNSNWMQKLPSLCLRKRMFAAPASATPPVER